MSSTTRATCDCGRKRSLSRRTVSAGEPCPDGIPAADIADFERTARGGAAVRILCGR
jgi:hypothetical protein